LNRESREKRFGKNLFVYFASFAITFVVPGARRSRRFNVSRAFGIREPKNARKLKRAEAGAPTFWTAAAGRGSGQVWRVAGAFLNGGS
jgi:hypothetical protein